MITDSQAGNVVETIATEMVSKETSPVEASSANTQDTVLTLTAAETKVKPLTEASLQLAERKDDVTEDGTDHITGQTIEAKAVADVTSSAQAAETPTTNVLLESKGRGMSCGCSLWRVRDTI